MVKIIFFLFCKILVYSNPLDGITLFSKGINSYLINNNYDFIKIWDHPERSVGTSYLNKERSIIVQLRSEEHNFGSSHGPIGGIFKKIDFNDQIIWEFLYYSNSYHPHHDFQPLPNGNLLVICWEKKTPSEVENFGRIQINDEFWPLKIVELMPLGLNDVEVVWEWHLWDHLIQDVDPDLPNYGDVSEHPELLDINLVEMINPNNGDWLHTNAIDYNESLDQIVFSSRFLDEIFIIDHSTTSEEASGSFGGISGKGGDFLYRWGNPKNYGRGTNDDKVLNDQHGVNWIKEGFPGEGNLIIFNNNPLDTTGQDHSIGNSSVIEIIPPLDSTFNYFIESGNSYGPEEPNWIYGGDSTFFSHFQSGSYRLKNGNTFITVSQEKYLFEINNENEKVWEMYLTSDTIAVGNIARAQKYTLDFFNPIFGDLNSNFEIDIIDVLYIQNIIYDNNYVFNGDLNNDGNIDLLDFELLINLILYEN